MRPTAATLAASQSALGQLERAVRWGWLAQPDLALAFERLGGRLASGEDYPAAERAFLGAVANGGETPARLHDLGLARARRGDLAAAEGLWRRALSSTQGSRRRARISADCWRWGDGSRRPRPSSGAPSNGRPPTPRLDCSSPAPSPRPATHGGQGRARRGSATRSRPARRRRARGRARVPAALSARLAVEAVLDALPDPVKLRPRFSLGTPSSRGTAPIPGRSRHAPGLVTISLSLPIVFALGGALADAGATLGAQAGTSTGPDVTILSLVDIDSYGGADGFHGYAVGTTSCNIGDDELNWCNTAGCDEGLTSKQHPVIAQNLYRLKAGRFEQIGMSWLKHGFFATNKGNAQTCRQGTACITPPAGFQQLGIGCTDTYWAGLNGDQPLGRRSEVNATISDFVFPYTNVGSRQIYGQRVKVADADVDPALNVGAVYWVEGQYVSDNDAAAGNGLNNASYRKATVEAGTFELLWSPIRRAISLPCASVRRSMPGRRPPAVELYPADVPGAIIERFEVARKVTAVDADTWHYEYAIHNVNSDRSARAFSVDFADGTPISGVGFHDVDSHSGEPYSTTDWTPVVTPGTGTVAWSTVELWRRPERQCPALGDHVQLLVRRRRAAGDRPDPARALQGGLPGRPAGALPRRRAVRRRFRVRADRRLERRLALAPVEPPP